MSVSSHTSGAVRCLELRGVTKRFGAQLALDDVSMRVQHGDCYGFIGHNGAGKTTTMRIALGLDRADAGRVLVDGFDATAYPREARARMGALIETPGFQGGWSGARNLTELGRLQGLSRLDARREAARWIERVGLSHAGAKPVQHYSQGMRQRLGIAQALLGSPRYVLLDEPTNGLDPEGIAEMRELVHALRRDEGFTFLVSSHQLHELSTICNRIGVLRGGRLLREAETADLLETAGARWRLEATDRDAAERALQALGLERRAGVPNDERGLWIDIGTRASADVTRRLVESGVGVVSFAPSQPTLEEIYLRFARADGSTNAAARPAPVAAVPVPPSTQPPTTTEPTEPTERLAAPRPIWRMASFDLRRHAGSAGLAILFATPAIVGAIALLRRAHQARADQGSIADETLFSATAVNGFEALGVALQAGLPVLGFLVLGLASQSIAAEYARGTLRNVLLRPMRRVECVLGKGLALVAAAAVGYAALVAVSLGLSAWLFDFGDVAEILPNGQKFLLTPASDLWPQMHTALVAPLLPLCAYLGIGFLSGAIARTGAGALGLALGLGAVLDLARAFARELGSGGLLPSDHLPSPLSDTSFLAYYVDVSQGVSNAAWAYEGKSLVVPLAWTLLSFALAARILQKRAIP